MPAAFADVPPDVPIVSLMKGVERGTGLRMSEVIASELQVDPDRIAVVSGFEKDADGCWRSRTNETPPPPKSQRRT